MPRFRSVGHLSVAVSTLVLGGCITDLGTFEGGVHSGALGINEHNVVVGWSEIGQEWSVGLAFIKRPGEDMVALGGPYGASSATAISDHGVVVGTASGNDDESHAVMWDADGTAHDIAVDASYRSAAIDVNDAGVVVGRAEDITSEGVDSRAFVYDSRTGEIDDLLLGETAYGINDSGDIVGRACLGTTCAAVMWTAGSHEIVALPGLGGRQTYTARDINDRGQIVGEGAGPTAQVSLLWASATQAPVESRSPSPPRTPPPRRSTTGGRLWGTAPSRAVLWDATSGETTWLGPEDGASWAIDINDAGIAVGRMTTGEPPSDGEAPPPAHAVVFGRPD